MSTPSDPSGSVAPTGDTHPTAYANPWIARSPVPEVHVPYAAPWPAPAPAALAQPQPGDVSQAFIDRTTAAEAARAAPKRPAPAVSSAVDPRIAMRDGGLDARPPGARPRPLGR
ncbi:hypothetical protein ACIRL2_35605 [Embleya sp. NPDC127516]|uniref:hypothetical protein n=1 Tax=Embleya sp. NPDC127516 TaxID=3363990 RepID=UPI003813B2E6